MSSARKTPKPLRRSITSSLTLWGAGIVFCICALLCIGLYAGLWYALQQEVDRFLEGEVREFMLTVGEFSGDDAGLERAIREELGSRRRHDLAFRLFNPDGRLIVSSERDDALAQLWQAPDNWTVRPPSFSFQTVRPANDPYPSRTCSLWITLPDGRRATAQASYRLDGLVRSLALFRRVCYAALAIAVVLAVASGRMIAHRSLSPIRTLNATAQQIKATNLAERMPVAHTGDELDQLAETINHMLDRIEQHVRQVQQFTADASHELRTPITVLRGTAELALTRHAPREELETALVESIEQYDRLLRLAEDLLLLARADAGEPLAKRECVHLSRAVQDVMDMYRPFAQERNVRLTRVDRLEPIIEGDGGRIRQLVGNVVDNALKHTPFGGEIALALSRTGHTVELEVTDTGPGIPPEHVEHVFDRFFRVERARSRSAGGAGLGLSICRTIVEAHGGTIDARNVPGAGAVIRIRLPACEDHPLQANSPVNAVPR